MSIILPPSDSIDIKILSSIFNKTTASYKFYWFLSILKSLQNYQGHGQKIISIEELVFNMLEKSWYCINFFKLSFGVSDQLATKIKDILNDEFLGQYFEANSHGDSFIKTLYEYREQKLIKDTVKDLSKQVKNFFLTPFLNRFRQGSSVIQMSRYAALSQEHADFCPYSLIKDKDGRDAILLQEHWCQYFYQYNRILNDFTNWHLLRFLEAKNPMTSNIGAKMFRPEVRESLAKQNNFWRHAITCAQNCNDELICIYDGNKLSTKALILDHFIPWSFVAHNYNFNLVPMNNAALNSSKSNKIPTKDFIEALAQQHFKAINLVQRAVDGHDLSAQDKNKILDILNDYSFIGIKADNVGSQSDFIKHYLDTFIPMQQNALNMGFAPWDF